MWNEVKVAELGKVVTGKTPKTAIGDNYGGDIPFLTPSDDMMTKYVRRTSKTLSEKGAISVKGAILPKDSVCVSCIGSDLGRVVITTERTVTNQQINSIIVNKDKYDVDFVYYAMIELGKILNVHSKSSTAVPIINKSTFSQYTIMCPDLEEQKNAVGILSALDRKIENASMLCENLQEQINTVFVSRFIQFDGVAQMRTSEVGTVPAEWKIVSLGEVTDNIRARVGSGQFPVLSAVNTGALVLSEEYFTKQVYSKDISKYIVVNENDFAYNPARVNIGSIGINDLGFVGCVSPVYVVFRAEPGYENFFEYFIKTPLFQEEVKLRASGSVRQAMNYGDFGLIKIAYPPKREMELFNNAIAPLKEEIRTLRAEIARTVEMRDALTKAILSEEFKPCKNSV